MQLRDRVAIVTGGDTGIGKAISLGFAREGASVVVDYHGDSRPADALIEEIENFGGRAAAVAADVATAGDVERLVATAVEKFGGVDVLVNNAGLEEKHPFLEMPLEVWTKVIAVNLTGVWLCTQAAAKHMASQKRGGRNYQYQLGARRHRNADERSLLRLKRRRTHADAHRCRRTGAARHHR